MEKRKEVQRPDLPTYGKFCQGNGPKKEHWGIQQNVFHVTSLVEEDHNKAVSRKTARGFLLSKV